ncbi:carbohydrate ABC transporter permease [Paenibacillus radicis (ex Gao et al. 2016)]|uniref:Sugar ABC transporter permease n=1 Tax=Paenibacillus radicis (ex Gao et al. 2016) TaxID=1737354 RepID=A0A917LWI2_9BACL|nr:carbohydrate ABC transporter permease [Paenibacillus radicis (ex Gao et al. 2016)]GGG61788.1 sugar ABC transporter permease [Paenibacillus radicis (ex Gao et al. 2016)]
MARAYARGRFMSGLAPNLILLVFSISCIFPAVWLFYSSLKGKSEFYANPISLPHSPSVDQYVAIFTKSKILLWMWNTTRNSVLSLLIILVLGFIIGYFLSRFRFKGRNALYNYYLLGMLVPIHALMVPMYVQFTQTGMSDKWFTLILPYAAFGLPIAIFLVDSYVRSIPIEVEEAACIDGCSFHRTLFSIVLPICRPILFTVGIIQFFVVWNEFTFALILNSKDSLMTVPVGITLFKGQFVTDYPKMMASMLIAIFPAMILYFAFSKQIIKGMVAGSVKG